MVGGEINYRCLGNDQYEIMVTVFRDCDTGVPWFDNPASVGVFDINDSLIYDLRLTLRNNDTLLLDLSDPCLVAPPNVCIHTTTYLDTISLPFRVGGYQVVYQRCCRNQDIVNIVAPTATGATYSSYISEQALLACNSSARFIEWPPVYICAGVPIVYDHSAIDPDGDSVVYELCTPFTGATPTQSMPQPPNNPPYNPVTWQPPYSVDNMLGGPDSLKIDAVSGLLTGTPDIIGVFVVGVCVKEYRNGVLISTTRRDFQYVVGVCGQISSSAFFAPQIQCDNSLIVNFQNSSTTIGTGFIWTFGDSSNNVTSALPDPTYIYPDTGYYTITLIADPGTLCADTSTQQIYLQYESISADFDVTTANCTDSFFLDITDLTIDSISTIVDWDWDFGNGDTDTIPYPSTVYSSSGTYVVNLNVLAANGCIANYTDTLNLDLPTIFGADTVGVCFGDSSLVLNPGGNPDHIYQWSPSTFLSSDTVASPVASPPGSMVYNVTVVVPNGVDTCVLERSITVVQSPEITLSLSNDTITCKDTMLLVASSNVQNVEWAFDPGFNTVFFVGDSLNVIVFGTTRYYVRAQDQYGCSIIDSVDVTKRTIPVTVDWTYNILVCDTAFTVQFTDLTTDSSGGAVVSWEWQFGDGFISQLQNPVHTYQSSGSYVVSLVVTTSDGCFGSYVAPVTVLISELTNADTVGICQGFSSVQLNPDGNAALQYQWSPAASLSDSSATSPVATPSVPTTYSVTITAVNGTDTCVLIKQVHVNFPPPFTVSVPSMTLYCGSSVDILATATAPVNTYEWAGDPSFNSILGTGNPYTAVPFTFPFAAYYVRATDPYGCTATDLALVQQNPVQVLVNFSYTSLGCSNTMTVQFNDLTTDTISSPLVSWLWTTSDGQSSTLQNPVFVFTQSQSTQVTLQVVNAEGCTGLLTQTLQLNIASLTNDSSVVLCGGDSSVILNAGGNPALTYTWAPASSLNNSTAADPMATPPSFPFVYSVTVTGFSAVDTCFAVHNVTVTQAPPITIEVPKDTIVCSSLFNLQANISNAVQVDWSFSPTFIPVAISNVTNFYLGLPPAPYDMLLYVRATDAYGCVVTDTARILRRNVTIPVDFTMSTGSCDDTLDVFLTNNTVLPPGFIPSSWIWSFGNGLSASTFNASTQYTSGSSHIISLSVSTTNGCSGTYVDTLNYALPILNSADSIGLCGYDSVLLNIGGNPDLTYQWSPATGLSDANIASPVASPDTTTNYTVTVTAVNNSDTCSLVHNVLISNDSFLFDVMPDTVLCINQVELFVNAPTASLVEWSLDPGFNLIIGQTNPLHTNINDSRWFYVRGSSIFGCEATDSVLIQYRGNDIPIDFSMSTLECTDSLVVAFQDISGDSTIISWNWDLGNGQTSSLQNPSAVYQSDSTYTIDLQILVHGNCQGQVQKQLSVQVPLLSVPNNNITICENDSVQLLIQSNPGLIFEWSPTTGLSDPSAANPMALPSQSTTYNIRVYGFSNFNGIIDTCYIEDSVRVNVQVPPSVQIQGDSVICDSAVSLLAVSPSVSSFEWSAISDFGIIIDLDSVLSAFLNGSSSTFFVRVEDSLGCQSVDSVLIFNRLADISISPFAFCDSQAVEVFVNNINSNDTLSYLWSPSSAIISGQGSDTVLVSPLNPVQISVVVQNQYGCMDSVQTSISIPPSISLSVPSDTLVCTPSVSITANSSPAALQYAWSSDSGFNTILGQNASLLTNVTGNQNVYYVQVQDSFGCVRMDSVLIDYYPADVIADSATVICEGLPVQLIAQNLNALDTLTYLWSPATDILSGQGSDTIVVAPSVSSVYTLTAQNQYGCITSVQSFVSVSSANPLISVSSSEDTVFSGTATQLSATFQNDFSYAWAADSTLSSDSIFNPVASPRNTTVYYLTVTDAYGCVTADSVIIFVHEALCEEPHVFVPNAFTPDGDGYNDVIFVQGAVITDIYFVIYNRWGEQVFETNVLYKGWDGTFKNVDCPPDVYGYYMKCRCLDGNELTKKGNITLLR